LQRGGAPPGKADERRQPLAKQWVDDPNFPAALSYALAFARLDRSPRVPMHMPIANDDKVRI
jgi:hypothetical protein